jgi:short-subunit dehydrogenase
MKTAVLTGASSGFGFLVCRELLKRGWNVFACLRNAEARRNLFTELQKDNGSQLELVDLDLSQAASRSRAIEQLTKSSSIDCLINNAGFGLFGALEDLSEDQLRHQFEVNFFGLVFLTKALLPKIRESKGRILNLSSTLGFTSIPLAGAYSASKFALEGMSEALFYDLKKSGVQVCLIEPGAFKTQFGQNMQWGVTSFSHLSVYSSECSAFKNYREQNRRRPAPEEVVYQILEACERPKIPLRIRVGKDAALAFWTRRILGESLYLWLVNFVFQKVFDRYRLKP